MDAMGAKKLTIGIFSIVLLALSVTGIAKKHRAIREVFESRYYGSQLCKYPDFKCIRIKRSDTWVRLFPNEREREIVKRLNRMNLPLSYRRWIVVPVNLKEITHMDLSPFPDTIKTTGQKTVIVNLSVHAFGAYDEKGNLVHWGPVSGGKGFCEDIKKPCTTALGSFRVIRKEGPGCLSETYPVETEGGAAMPYCMYFYRGYALHGSTLPGFHASHGCVRLFYDDAEWLNTQFLPMGARVIVTR